MNRRLVVWLSVVSGTVLSLWACTRHSPTAPSAVSTGQQVADGAGDRRLQVIPSSSPIGPSPRPVGPTASPVGPTVRPSTGPTASPIGPTPTPIGPGSGTPPPATGSPGGPGVPTPPGGGGTPPPSGGGTCPALVVLDSSDTPRVLTGVPTSVSRIELPLSLQECRITDMRVSFHLVSPSLASLSAANVRAFVQLVRNNLVSAASDLFRSTGTPLSGTDMGTGCPGSAGTPISFFEGGSIFPGPPPYAEGYQPFGLIGFPGFSNFDGRAASGEMQLGLQYGSTSTTATLNCWRIELTLQ